MKKQRLRFCIYIAVLAVVLFSIYGRSVWYPYYLKIKGRRTTADVYQDIGERITKDFREKFQKVHLTYPPQHLTIIALKKEKILEIWANTISKNPEMIESYPFTGASGKIGPKLRSGDKQIPEGLYKIEYLNPNSSYHLSLKISYPNVFDTKMAKADGRENLGGDIFIHGKNVTIGCIPIGDTNIEKLFILAYTIGIENIDVIISPYDMRVKNMSIPDNQPDWLTAKYKRIRSALADYENKSVLAR